MLEKLIDKFDFNYLKRAGKATVLSLALLGSYNVLNAEEAKPAKPEKPSELGITAPEARAARKAAKESKPKKERKPFTPTDSYKWSVGFGPAKLESGKPWAYLFSLGRDVTTRLRLVAILGSSFGEESTDLQISVDYKTGAIIDSVRETSTETRKETPLVIGPFAEYKLFEQLNFGLGYLFATEKEDVTENSTLRVLSKTGTELKRVEVQKNSQNSRSNGYGLACLNAYKKGAGIRACGTHKKGWFVQYQKRF